MVVTPGGTTATWLKAGLETSPGGRMRWMEAIPPRSQGPPTIRWPYGDRAGQTDDMTTGPRGLAASGEQLSVTAAQALQDLLDRDDPEVVGVVLSGSAGRGLAT